MKAPLIILAGLLAVGSATAFKWDDMVVKPKLRAGLERTLKDAGSVEYRGEVLTRNGTNLCGEFNARNGYGAYAGFKRFIAEPNRHIVEGDPPSKWHGDNFDAMIKNLTATNAQAFDELWRDRCTAA